VNDIFGTSLETAITKKKKINEFLRKPAHQKGKISMIALRGSCAALSLGIVGKSPTEKCQKSEGMIGRSAADITNHLT
jgi:hypothetical protein